LDFIIASGIEEHEKRLSQFFNTKAAGVNRPKLSVKQIETASNEFNYNSIV